MTTTKLITSFALIAIATSFAPRLRAQTTDSSSTTAGATRDQQLLDVADEHARLAGEEAKRANDQARRATEQVRRNVESLQRSQKQLADAQRDFAEAAQVSVAGSPFGEQVMVETKDGKNRTWSVHPRPGGAQDQCLVVASSALEPAAQAELKEDLNVMAKLVDDAVADDRDEKQGYRAMGISLNFLGDTSPARHLYLEGHGAILQASVRFPLRAQEKKTPAHAKQPARKSAWDQARRELYGGKEEENDGEPPDAKVEEFNEERVESLKKNILKALANANNFRHLGRDETVTVVVRSAGGGRRLFVGGGGSGGSGGVLDILKPPPVEARAGTAPNAYVNRSGAGVRRGAAGAESTMTIRVKKSDADALAAGKINEEEFRKRATVAVY